MDTSFIGNQGIETLRIAVHRWSRNEIQLNQGQVEELGELISDARKLGIEGSVQLQSDYKLLRVLREAQDFLRDVAPPPAITPKKRRKKKEPTDSE